MVSIEFLLSCDAMFFSVGSQFFGENAFFGDRYFFILIFSQSSLYNPITPKLFKVFGLTYIGM